MPVTRATMTRLRAQAAELEAAVSDADAQVVRAYVTAWDEVAGQLSDAVLQLADEPITATRVLRSSRIASALQVIAERLDALAAEAALTVGGWAGRVVTFTAAAQAEIAATQLPADGGGIQLATVRPDVIGSIVSRTAQQITARTRPLAQAGQDAVRQMLVQGAAEAANPVKVARGMVRLARAGGVDLPVARARTIARTELNDAARQAARAFDQANGDVLAGWEWLSNRSPTTCPACWAMDGTVHDAAEPGPDGHPNCRCTRMPRTKTWADLGLDVPEPAGLVRPTAEATFYALPREQQVAIMGPGRLRALEQGAGWSSLVTVRDNPEWRRSHQPTPVRDLGVA